MPSWRQAVGVVLVLIALSAIAQYGELSSTDLELQVSIRAPRAMYVGRAEAITVDVIHAFPERVEASLDLPAGMKSRLIRKWRLGRVTARFQFEVTSEVTGMQVFRAVARTSETTAADTATISVRTFGAFRLAELLGKYDELLRLFALAIIVTAVLLRGPIARVLRAEVVATITAVVGLAPLAAAEWLGRVPTSIDYALGGGGAAIGIFDVVKRFVEHSRQKQRASGARGNAVGHSLPPAGARPVHESIIGVPAGGYASVRDVFDSLLASSAMKTQEALRRADNHKIYGVTIGLSGLVFFFLTTSSLIPETGSAGMSWSVLGFSLLKIAPRVAVLIFIELTAGFFLKQYSAAMIEYHEYERRERQRETETLSFLIRAQGGGKEDLDEFAKTIMFHPDDVKLHAGETTTHLAAQEKTPNEMLEIMKKAHESLVDLTEAATKLTKEQQKP